VELEWSGVAGVELNFLEQSGPKQALKQKKCTITLSIRQQFTMLEPEYLVMFGAASKAKANNDMPNHLAPQIWSTGNKIIPSSDVMPTCYGDKEATTHRYWLGR
jgi:hypothetical protein